MVEDRLREATVSLKEYGFSNPRLESGSFRVGNEPDDIISLPIRSIDKVDLPEDDEYSSWVKIHMENNVEKVIDVFDIDRSAIGDRLLRMFTSTGKITILFRDGGKVFIEQGNVWSTDFRAFQ